MYKNSSKYLKTHSGSQGRITSPRGRNDEKLPTTDSGPEFEMYALSRVRVHEVPVQNGLPCDCSPEEAQILEEYRRILCGRLAQAPHQEQLTLSSRIKLIERIITSSRARSNRRGGGASTVVKKSAGTRTSGSLIIAQPVKPRKPAPPPFNPIPITNDKVGGRGYEAEIISICREVMGGGDIARATLAYDNLLRRSPYLELHLRSTGATEVLAALHAIPQVLEKRRTDKAERDKAERNKVERDKAERDKASADQLLQELCIEQMLQSDYLGADKALERKLSGRNLAERVRSLVWEAYEEKKTEYVRRWIAGHLPGKDSAGGPTLDDEQVAAIATLHGHVELVARAGSGKTTTLVNRVLFLVQNCGIDPETILILAFNRRAAGEVRKRLLTLTSPGTDAAVSAEVTRQMQGKSRGAGIDRSEIEDKAVNSVATAFNVRLPHIMTFHALAYAIVRPEESLLYDEPDGDSQGLSKTVQRVIGDHLLDEHFRRTVRDLMLAHFREDWERIVAGRYDQSKEELLRFRRSLQRESMRGEYVKSYGEKVIADFLFENDLSYQYERNWWWRGRNYHPDFTIYGAADRGVIIEYFGLQGDPDYDVMSEEKRDYWNSMPDWSLIEFCPEDFQEGVNKFRDRLKARIEEHGIVCSRLPEDEIWNRVRERSIDRFTKACVGFISKCRKLSLLPSDMQSMRAAHRALSPVEDMFLGHALQLYAAYLDRLAAAGEEDFDGLVQRAADAIAAGNTRFERKLGSGDLASLKYLCIDEFQDFSELFYRMLSAIRKRNPSVELFCVGDDWQAINGFAGSDLRFFNDFQNYVGSFHRLHLSKNYRSSSSIVGVGNVLMAGMGKPAVANRSTTGTVLVADIEEFEPTMIEKQRHPGDDITPAVCRLANSALASGVGMVMLCRTNALPWYVSYAGLNNNRRHGLDRYLDHVRSLLPKGLGERISISTAHKYKGMEKPMVVVLDAVARSYPLIHPDWVLGRIFGDSPSKMTDEERRLFYVALTRAADTLVIITDGRYKSPFLNDIEKAMRLPSIKWEDYPPSRGESGRIVVRVLNQQGRGATPTFTIKDLLKASGYQWQSGSRQGWAKSLPTEGFRVEMLQAEIWATKADGIEVQIHDDTETLIEQYVVDNGTWKRLSSALPGVGAPKDVSE